MKPIKYTKELAIKNIQSIYIEIGEVPYRRHLIKLKSNPDYSWYLRNFESWENVLKEANIIDEHVSEKQKLENSIETLRKLSNELNRIPTTTEYDKYRDKKKTVHITTLRKRLNKTYSQICREYLSYKVIRNYDISNQQIIQDFISFKNKIKRIPYEREFSSETGYSGKLITIRFGKYTNLIKASGYQPTREPKYRTDDELLDIFKEFMNENNRLPTSRELNSISYKFLNRFKSIENICKILNINFYDYTILNGNRSAIFNKRKELCKSIAEAKISNFFIDNNIDYVKEYPYANLIEGDRRLFDWKIKINNKNYFVEYFGMYNSKSEKNSFSGKYTKKTKKKMKDLYKNNYNEDTIYLFPIHLEKKELFEEFFNSLFKPKLDYSSIHENIFTNNISEDELVKQLMKYSDNDEFLPAYSVLEKNKKLSLYNMAVRNHKNYEEFGKSVGKKTRKRKKTDKDKNWLFSIMYEMLEKTGRIIEPSKIKESNFFSYRGYEHNCRILGGFHFLRFEFLLQHIKKNKKIPKNEYDIVYKTNKKIFPYGTPKEDVYCLSDEILTFINKEGVVIE